MKKFIILFAALAAVLSCSKENPSNYNPVDGTYSVTLTASAPGADTKTTLVDGGAEKFVHWSKGDAIKVLFFPNHKASAAISVPPGVFTSNFDEEYSSKAYFMSESWSWGSVVPIQVSDMLMNKGIAVYPSTSTATSIKPQNNASTICETEVSYVLPSAQTAVKGNIESNLNFSYADVNLSEFESTILNGTQTDLKFKNACAMIELTMPSTLDKKVTSISIVSNDDVPLTGKGVALMSYYKNEIDSNPNINDGVDHIFKPEISEGDGVTLINSNGFESGAKYYVVVWPGKHDSGLTIRFIAEDGSKATKTTGAVELTASKVKPYSFNKGLVFESSIFNYVYSDGSQGNDVRSDIVGVVFFHGNPKTQFNDSALPDQYCNGLAISTKNVVTTWGGSSSFTVPSGVNTSPSNFGKGGYSAKKIITDAGLNLPIYNNSSYSDLSLCNTSGWYIGTNKEWDYILSVKDDINTLLEAAGCDLIQFATQSGNSAAIWLPLLSGNNVYLAYTNYYGDTMQYGTNSSIWYYSSTRVARPIFAF